MRTFPDTLISVISKSDLNTNQISQISGISNTYLNKLLNRKINHPGKDKITSVLLALNYKIAEINQVLAEYDYLPLNPHDIPQILENNRKRKFEGRIVPHFDFIYFELVMAALEHIGGTKIIIKDRPSGIYIPMDLYMMKEFPLELDDDAARFFMTFTHDVVIERKSLFAENCGKGYRYETYICKECLEENLDKYIGEKAQAASMTKVALFARYFANAVSASLKFPDQHIHRVVKRCTYFQFQIQDAEGKNPKVSFTSDKRHYYHKEWESLNIEGFLSNAPGITDLFFNEVDKCRKATKETQGINTPDGFCAYIREVFDSHGVKKLFDAALAQLMAFQGLKLY
jgi:hypothetical protein